MPENEKSDKKNPPAGLESKTGNISRRTFVAGATTAAAVAAVVPSVPLLGGKESAAEASVVGYNSGRRAAQSFNFRRNAAQAENINVGVQADNGDAARFTDHSALHTKALKHDALGVPNASSFASFKNALTTGEHEDFENIQVGTPGGNGNSKLNGPQVSFAFDLEGLDSHATVIPAAPSVASAQTAAEEIEHYWGALLRDVPFSEYPTNSLAAQAAADLNNTAFVQGGGANQIPTPVTPQNLFRGKFVAGDGNVQGPYISQFMVQPASYGAQALNQQFRTYMPGLVNEFMTTVSEYQLVQNGGDSGRPSVFDPTPRHLRNGRDLAAWTNVDVLFQGYFTAFMVLAGIGTPPNPGNPYIGSQTEKAFATLGGPDAAGTIGEMATRALKGAWFHKWIKDLRQRPEEYGALVHARKTGTTPAPQAAAALHPDMLNSAVLPLIHSNFGSYLLPQAFPEGSPTHPCYPTGHGTVGGACCTALKFFFDCNQKIRPLLLSHGRDVVESSTDGLSVNTYTGADRDNLDINGELNKLAWNITTGHGIHAGIHFRSSSYWSILLGEQIALSVLRDRAKSYNEPFTIKITKFNGQTATITNRKDQDDHDGDRDDR